MKNWPKHQNLKQVMSNKKQTNLRKLICKERILEKISLLMNRINLLDHRQLKCKNRLDLFQVYL